MEGSRLVAVKPDKGFATGASVGTPVKASTPQPFILKFLCRCYKRYEIGLFNMRPTVVGLVFGASFMWSLEELQFLVLSFQIQKVPLRLTLGCSAVGAPPHTSPTARATFFSPLNACFTGHL